MKPVELAQKIYDLIVNEDRHVSDSALAIAKEMVTCHDREAFARQSGQFWAYLDAPKHVSDPEALQESPAVA